MPTYERDVTSEGITIRFVLSVSGGMKVLNLREVQEGEAEPISLRPPRVNGIMLPAAGLSEAYIGGTLGMLRLAIEETHPGLVNKMIEILLAHADGIYATT